MMFPCRAIQKFTNCECGWLPWLVAIDGSIVGYFANLSISHEEVNLMFVHGDLASVEASIMASYA